MGRPEGNQVRLSAMTELGLGLSDANHHEDALSLQETKLAMLRRLGASAHNILVVQGNLARTYAMHGRVDESLRMRRDIYSGFLKLHGEEYFDTLLLANNLATSLRGLESTSKKRRNSCAKQCPWRDAPLERTMTSR